MDECPLNVSATGVVLIGPALLCLSWWKVLADLRGGLLISSETLYVSFEEGLPLLVFIYIYLGGFPQRDATDLLTVF
ncbi:hypothetical protein QBC44DRAFT_29391 [Cladorrhinum sp. PSN332]|nr:hypothetical protein QBC44DRAFT_29391 [Cladorrhinum sp. PSN332]